MGCPLLHLFAGLAYSRLDVDAIIGREKMKLSKFAQEMKEEGRREGFLEGLQGAFRESLREAHRGGQIAARHMDILMVLEVRLGAGILAEFEIALNAIADFDQLGRLLLLASKVADADSFRSALAQARAAS
jgi:hypothetical protein